jgi:hypothetical protein
MIDQAVKEANSQSEERPDTIRFKIYRGQSPDGESIFEIYQSPRIRVNRLRIIEHEQSPPDNVYPLHLEDQAEQVEDDLDIPQLRWHHSHPSRFYTGLKSVAAAGLIAFFGGLYSGLTSSNYESRQVETSQPEKKTLEHVARASLPSEIINHNVFDPEYLMELQEQAQHNNKLLQEEQAKALVDGAIIAKDKLLSLAMNMIEDYRESISRTRRAKF